MRYLLLFLYPMIRSGSKSTYSCELKFSNCTKKSKLKGDQNVNQRITEIAPYGAKLVFEKVVIK